ncbi:hypothetical protein [Polyangium aurulentum]|uniref:hypothetical protein n=1 Tax=Polyangium aurulentum TaxID=2567896 RepID=UPI0010ADD49C|nr:hypothetical protein [Polyangium aurulentum]UQA61712.1 hypothetical protein E8A73_015055 [Polyangium aurulentum]
MKRDSLFGEEVVWSGRPKVVECPLLYRVAAAVCAVFSAISTASAIVVATALDRQTGPMLAFAAWMATLALVFALGPKWWRSELEFVVTERHVVLQRGRLRRTMDRAAISFARIHWNPKNPGAGDLELVRAVPTGALRRRLSIVLTGIVAPDRVWAIIRGVTPATPAGDGHRLLAQRLDEGERVLWSGHPPDRWRRWLPTSWRAFASLGLGIWLVVAAIMTSVHSVHAVRTVVSAGILPESVTFVALVTSLALTSLLLASAAGIIVYASVVRPARLEKETRYWITDRRVLIQRGDEELHLDRSRIVDVIDSPAEKGLKHLFLVLDGPMARAFASSGAFGERNVQGLQPVLHRIADADAVRRIILHGPAEPLPEPVA